MVSSSSKSSTGVSSSSASSTSSKQTYQNPADDPYLGKQYYLNHIGDIYQAWESYRGDGVTIAVIDMGFNPNHEDFFYSDGASKVSPQSASFVTTGTSTTKSIGVDKVVNMGESHGTFCAGVAAAAINGKGVVGIAPNAKLLLLKTDGKPRSIGAAFRYAADEGAKVISVSIGSYNGYEGDLQSDGSDLTTCFDEPVAYCRSKGTVVVSAGGNGGLDGRATEYTYPGAAKGVIGVGGLAANSDDSLWSGSSYNYSSQYQFIDCVAPSDQMAGCCHYDGKLYDSGWNGTSFAAPQVAGMAALYFQKNPSASVADFESALYASCHALPSTEPNVGKGRVDVGALLGLTPKGTFTVTVKTNWTSCYAYAWNEETQQENGAWPGQAMKKVNGGYSIELDASKYCGLVFSSGNNQTIDLSLSSFRFGKAYDLSGSDSYQGKRIGKFA